MGHLHGQAQVRGGVDQRALGVCCSLRPCQTHQAQTCEVSGGCSKEGMGSATLSGFHPRHHLVHRVFCEDKHGLIGGTGREVPSPSLG